MNALSPPAPAVPNASYDETRFNALQHGLLSRYAVLPWEDRAEYQALLDALLTEKLPIVRSVRLFDLYQGKSLPPGRKSLAFRIVMQDTEKTLTDAEADLAIAQMVELLGERFGGTLRT